MLKEPIWLRPSPRAAEAETDLIDRLWHSRAARLSWAAATALLLAANLATLGAGGGGRRAVTVRSAAPSGATALGVGVGDVVRLGAATRTPSRSPLGGSMLASRGRAREAVAGWTWDLDRLAAGGDGPGVAP